MSETTETSRTARTLPDGKGTRMPDKPDTKDTKDEPAEAGKGGKKKLLVLGVAVVALLAAAYVLVLAPNGSGKAAAPPKPTPGAVVKLEPITVNLAGGHFLKLGLSLQASVDAGEEVSGAKALDAAIEQFSGKTVQDLASRSGRDKEKHALVDAVSELYEGKVYDLYFTDFVMQ
jgi:flagellar FliL protein